MSHPIQDFIDNLFPTKPQQKRNSWAQFLIDQQYDNVDDLKSISDDVWKDISKTIPLKISQDIKKSLRQMDKKSVQPALQENKDRSEKQQIQQKNSNILDISQQKSNHENQSTISGSQLQIEQPEQSVKLSKDDEDTIIQLLNNDLSHQKILKIMKAQSKSVRGDAILTKIKLLIQPPKPYPQNCKKVSVITTGSSLPLFLYKGRHDHLRKYYTLLIIGETGSGKTTLLDAFVNKLTGMQFTDNWRYKLVDEDHLLGLGGGQSKTSEITQYYINDVKNQFNIRIIDTPGFGDTKGIKVDDEITNKFQSLFQEIPQIDYILLTIKATETRLKAGSKYVYDRVQQIFGVDAKDRFIMMCTFADGKPPLCLKTIQQENILYEKYFTFNNSALYTPSDQGDATTKFFWKMAMESVELFGQYVIKSDRIPLSLTLSSSVLQARKYLCQSIKTSQQALKQSFSQLDNAKKVFALIKENKKKIQENGSFTYQETKPKFQRVKLGNTYQMCNNCQVTCCQICVWPQNQVQSRCSYFNGGNPCPKCPGKCPRSAHIRTDECITKTIQTYTVTVDCKKQAYEEGKSGVSTYTGLLTKSIQKIDSLAARIWALAQDIKNNLKKLQEIALKPKLFTDEEFYQQMIKAEEERKETGYTTRIKAINQVLERKKALTKISESSKVDDLFPELKQLKADCKVAIEKEGGICQIF